MREIRTSDGIIHVLELSIPATLLASSQLSYKDHSKSTEASVCSYERQTYLWYAQIAALGVHNGSGATLDVKFGSNAWKSSEMHIYLLSWGSSSILEPPKIFKCFMLRYRRHMRAISMHLQCSIAFCVTTLVLAPGDIRILREVYKGEDRQDRKCAMVDAASSFV